MRLSHPIIALAALASTQTVTAQNMTSNGTESSADFASGLIAALTQGGLTSLVAAVSQLGPTAAGAKFLNDVQAGPATLFAPTNGALSGLASDVTGNMTRLAAVLQYHLLNGTYSADRVATAPAHTIARTTLTELEFANIPRGQDLGQAIVLYKTNASGVQIDQPYRSWDGHHGNISTEMPTISYRNLTIYPVGQVIALPPTLGEFATQNASAIATVLTSLQLVDPLSSLRGSTIFLPTNEAVAKLGQEAIMALNATALRTILSNHVVNGSVVYSTGLGSTTGPVSLAGEPFKFAMNGGNATVTSGNVTANIVASDIITANGVVHLIDTVLANPNSNTQAAESAASVAATASMTTDVGVGPTQGTGGGSGQSGSGGSSGSAGGAGGAGGASQTGTATGTRAAGGSATAGSGGGGNTGSGAGPVAGGAIKGVVAAIVIGAVAMVWV